MSNVSPPPSSLRQRGTTDTRDTPPPPSFAQVTTVMTAINFITLMKRFHTASAFSDWDVDMLLRQIYGQVGVSCRVRGGLELMLVLLC